LLELFAQTLPAPPPGASTFCVGADFAGFAAAGALGAPMSGASGFGTVVWANAVAADNAANRATKVFFMVSPGASSMSNHIPTQHYRLKR
jgi:hypothetical protein